MTIDHVGTHPHCHARASWRNRLDAHAEHLRSLIRTIELVSCELRNALPAIHAVS
jgi:hypothetical protein